MILNYKATSHSSFLCVLVISFLIFSSCGFAGESFNPHKVAQRYLAADLVIVGNVLSCTTKVIKKDSSVSDSGWVRHWIISIDICKTKVDTVVKGVFTDSIIIIQSKLYAGNIFETAPPGFEGKNITMLDLDGGRDDRIYDWNIHRHRNMHEQKNIILLQKKDSTYVSTLSQMYDKDIIDYFYKGLDKEGLNYFKSKHKKEFE